jgi:hypothetical protein
MACRSQQERVRDAICSSYDRPKATGKDAMLFHMRVTAGSQTARRRDKAYGNGYMKGYLQGVGSRACDNGTEKSKCQARRQQHDTREMSIG